MSIIKKIWSKIKTQSGLFKWWLDKDLDDRIPQNKIAIAFATIDVF